MLETGIWVTARAAGAIAPLQTHKQQDKMTAKN